MPKHLIIVMTVRYSLTKFDRAIIDEATGYMKVDATMARVGVQTYLTQDGVRRELRPTDQVENSAQSFNFAPLTLEHPSQAVDSKTYKDVAVGVIPSAIYDDGLIKTKDGLLVQDETAIQAATTTHQQLSAGYLVDLVDEKGTWIDEFGVQGPPGTAYEYDAVQTNIRINHVALVERGRAGQIASLKFDSISDNNYRNIIKADTGYEIPSDVKLDSFTQKDTGTKKMPITIDGKDYNETQVVDLFHTIKNDHKTALETATKATKEANDRADQSEGKVLAAEKQIAELNTQIETLKSDEDIQKEIAARTDAWITAMPILEVEKADYSKSASEVNKMVVTKLAPEINLDGMSDATIQGLYMGLMANYKPQAKVDDATAGTPATKEEKAKKDADDIAAAFKASLMKSATAPSVDKEVQDAYDKYDDDLANAWKLPATK